MDSSVHAAKAEAAVEAAAVAKEGLQTAGRACVNAGEHFLKTNNLLECARSSFECARAAVVRSRSTKQESQTHFELMLCAANEADRCADAAGAAAEASYEAMIERHLASFHRASWHAPYGVQRLFKALGAGTRLPTPDMYLEFRDCSLEEKQRILVWYTGEGADYSAKSHALASVNGLDRDGQPTFAEETSDDNASFEDKEAKRKRWASRHLRAEGPGNAKRKHRARQAKRLRGPSPIMGPCGCPTGSPAPSPVKSRYEGSDASGSDFSDYEEPMRQPFEVEEPQTSPQGGAPCLVFCDAEPISLKFLVAPELYFADNTRIGPADVQVGLRLTEAQSVVAHCVLLQTQDGWKLRGAGEWEMSGLEVDGAPLATTTEVPLLLGNRVNFILSGGVVSYTFCA